MPPVYLSVALRGATTRVEDWIWDSPYIAYTQRAPFWVIDVRKTGAIVVGSPHLLGLPIGPSE